MLSVIVRWTVVDAHERIHVSWPHLGAETDPALDDLADHQKCATVTNFCEPKLQLRHSHNAVHSNSPHTMVIHALNAADTMAPAHSVGVGQSTVIALPEPLDTHDRQPKRLLTCASDARHNQAAIGPGVTLQSAATQHPSVTQFSSAAKRTKVEEGVTAAWRRLCIKGRLDLLAYMRRSQ